MSQQIKEGEHIRQYLLGELSEEEREQVERRLLSDEEFYQQVLIAEDELVYDFVCDELPAQEKMSFRQHVLPIPERRQDVKFARALRKYVSENAPRVVEAPTVRSERTSWLEALAAFFRRPVVGLALSAGLLLALSLSAWIAIQNRRLRTQVAQLETQRTPPTAATTPPQDLQEQLASERQNNADLADELRREKERRADVERTLETATGQTGQPPAPRPAPAPRYVPTVATVLLTPGAARDAANDAIKKIAVPRGVREIPLQLDLGTGDYRSYRAVLKTFDGQKELLTRKMLRARTRRGQVTVSLSLPARLLSRGDYQIQLIGENPAGDYAEVDKYYFRVAQ